MEDIPSKELMDLINSIKYIENKYLRNSNDINSIKIDWYIKIANPAFEQNLTLLYDKLERNDDEIRKLIIKTDIHKIE